MEYGTNDLEELELVVLHPRHPQVCLAQARQPELHCSAKIIHWSWSMRSAMAVVASGITEQLMRAAGRSRF